MPAIRVKATRKGHYITLKEPGAVFMVAGAAELGSWMEPADAKDQDTFDKEFAKRKAARRNAYEGSTSKMERMANTQAKRYGNKRKAVPDEDLGL